MPRVTVHVGGRERLHPTISKGTLLLPTDALVEAADLADAYDADPEAYNEREQGQRDPTE